MRFDEDRDSEEFFDSASCLSVEESDPCDAEEYSSKEFAVWLSEPQSVEQRRRQFLLGMGLGEWGCRVCSSSDNFLEPNGDLIQINGTEGAAETRESVSSGYDCVEDDSIRSRNEVGSCGSSFISDGDLESLSAVDSTMARDLSADQANDRGKRRSELSLWKSLLEKLSRRRSVVKPAMEARKSPALTRVKTRHNKKRALELSALYSGQDIQAHVGVIRTMKFSPDGQYLATGGEDGIVCIWRIVSADVSSEDWCGGPEIYSKGKRVERLGSVLKPDKIFWIDESPVHAFRSYNGDILDLAWSSSNRLLSSSKDNTVRLYQVGSDLCQDVFRHSNYVTCIQFNPIDDDFFISGSIDGKARVWSVSTRRVVDWADVRDAISAICYRPHGKGFAVGTITGACHFYETTDAHVHRDSTITIPARRKRNSGNKVTSIQFSEDTSGRVLISSQDSKLRLFEGNNMIYKYKGAGNAGIPTSASFSSIKNHVVSVGEDSSIYLWNQRDGSTKSAPPHEYFSSKGAYVVVPWSGNCTANANITCSHRGKGPYQRFSLGKWFSQDGQCRTWPEEQLVKHTPLAETWGLVFVTGSRDGRIRTFHNYGMPTRP